MSSSTTATRRPRSSMGPIGTSVGEATTNQPVIDIECGSESIFCRAVPMTDVTSPP